MKLVLLLIKPSSVARRRGKALVALDGHNRSTGTVIETGRVCLRIAVALCFGIPCAVWAQDTFYQCGREYRDESTVAQAKNCKPVTAALSLGDRHRPAAPEAAAARRASSSGMTPSSRTATSAGISTSTTIPRVARIDPADQRARDSDAHAILEDELKKAEARRAELIRAAENRKLFSAQFDGGDAAIAGNRSAELLAATARNDTDITALKKELGRISSFR